MSATPAAAFTRVVRDHQRWLAALALRLTGSPSDAQDLTQDTLERALEAFERLRPGSNVRGWLASILNNQFIDRCRRRAREGTSVDASSVEHLVAPAAPEAEPDWLRLSPAQVGAAVARLDEPFRSVYQLHLEGCSYEQISQRLGVPRATIGTRLLRARLRLRELLAGVEVDHG